MQPPRVGEVWERDGRRRVVQSLEGNVDFVGYGIPPTRAIYYVDIEAWAEWASKARKVEDGNGS